MEKIDNKEDPNENDIPFFHAGSLILVFGQSRSGKSWWLRNLILENECHFEKEIKQLVFIHQQDNPENDTNISLISKKFKKNAVITKTLIPDVHKTLIPNQSLIVFDDCELMLKQKKHREILDNLAFIYAHNNKITVIISFQTYGLFYKSSPLNHLVYQATNFVLFGSNNVGNRSLGPMLNAFEVQIKDGKLLYDLFIEYVLQRGVDPKKRVKYRYLLVHLHPDLPSSEVWSNILDCDSNPLLGYHE